MKKLMKKEEVIKDINFICAQTNARWLCYDDIHTSDQEADVEKFIKAFEWCGFSKKEMIEGRYIVPKYGGGFAINHREEADMGGYTVNFDGKKQSLVVLPGFDLSLEHQTVYHEAGHLYQAKHNLFNLDYNNPYGKYLMEIHAETFASMVMLLKAKNVIDYKKAKLRCLLNSADRFYDKKKTDKKMVYYMSLPVELEMMRHIRRAGRKNVLKKFSTSQNLNFEKIAFYTADLVKKHAYSRADFSKIMKDQKPAKYAYLRKRVQAWRVLGELYAGIQFDKYTDITTRHVAIDKQRERLQQVLTQNLPENSKRNAIINAVCAIDTCYVLLQRSFNVRDNLDKIVKTNKAVKHAQNNGSLGDFDCIRQKMVDLYQKWNTEPFFLTLFKKIKSFETRDDVWNIHRQTMLQYQQILAQKQEQQKCR